MNHVDPVDPENFSWLCHGTKAGSTSSDDVDPMLIQLIHYESISFRNGSTSGEWINIVFDVDPLFMA